jgi:hypothetical protein
MSCTAADGPETPAKEAQDATSCWWCAALQVLQIVSTAFKAIKKHTRL